LPGRRRASASRRRSRGPCRAAAHRQTRPAPSDSYDPLVKTPTKRKDPPATAASVSRGRRCGGWPPPLRQPRSRWLPLSTPLRRGRRLRGSRLDWPCGQNPGRKPEDRQHASTRKAMSLGEQDSTCWASTSLCVATLLPHHDKYCHNGGMAFAHHHGVGSPGGPRWRSWPLSGGPLKTAGLQGEKPQRPGSVPFGGSNGLVDLRNVEQSRQVLPQRGYGLRTTSTATAGSGSKKAIMAPSCGP